MGKHLKSLCFFGEQNGLEIVIAYMRDLVKIVALSVVLMLGTPIRTCAADWRQEFTRALKNGGAYVEDSAGKVVLAYRADDHFIPASTIKLATAACALELLGPEFRFVTKFYQVKDQTLYIKGFGDPRLVSEELALIATELAKQIKTVRNIVIDDSYFDPALAIDGVSNSANPYDAVNGALIANFNTINFNKLKNGRIDSAEPQTPLTEVARIVARKYQAGKQRVNLGPDRELGARYFGELLTAFLTPSGVTVSGSTSRGAIPHDAHLIYEHRSSYSLQENLREVLDYSTNFTANQIFLALGAEKFSPPATVEKGARVLTEFLRKKIGWGDFTVVEGAGLSRRNQVTPRQMVTLLKSFERYRELLPIEQGIVQGKTGSLTGANTLVGYLLLDGDREVRFSILVNSNVAFDYKFQLAKMLHQALL